MRTDHRAAFKVVAFGILMGFALWISPAYANLKEIKAYKEAFPEAKPKCINCHEAEKPKKDEGMHEWNDYGKAARAIDPKPTAEVFKKLGSFEDFAKNAKPAADKK